MFASWFLQQLCPSRSAGTIAPKLSQPRCTDSAPSRILPPSGVERELAWLACPSPPSQALPVWRAREHTSLFLPLSPPLHSLLFPPPSTSLSITTVTNCDTDHSLSSQRQIPHSRVHSHSSTTSSTQIPQQTSSSFLTFPELEPTASSAPLPAPI